MSHRKRPTNSSTSRLALEAAEWLLRLQETEPDSEEPYPDLADRWGAFLKWLNLSAKHVRAVLEILETDRRLRSIRSRAAWVRR